MITKIIAEYGTCDPFRLAKKMNIEVVFQTLPTFVGGILKTHPHRQIICNTAANDASRRLIVSHKIAHFLLHPRYISGTFTADHFFKPATQDDLEATQFALDLLTLTEEYKSRFEAYEYFQRNPQTEFAKQMIASMAL